MAKTRIFRLKVAATLSGLLLLLGGCLAAGALNNLDASLTGADSGTSRTSRARADSGKAGQAEVGALSPEVFGDRLTVVDMGGQRMHIRLVGVGGAGAAQERPLGYISPDGATLYAVEEVRSQTILRAYDMDSGRQLRHTTLDGQYFVPAETSKEPQLAISGDGRRMILNQMVADPELKTQLKTGYPRSRFVVIDTDFARPPKLLDLEGEFWFDALSRDGAWLYLIEIQDTYPMSYSPEKAPRYRVRAYDINSGRLLPDPVVDKRDLDQMTGYQRAWIHSINGDWLYSLYTRPREGPFIHALNLTNQSALCIDLPFPPPADYASDILWALALSDDGRMLYAVNGSTGQVAQVNMADGYTVRRSATLPPPAAPQAAIPSLLSRIGHWLSPVAEAKMIRVPGAVLTLDGKTLFALGQKGLLAINTADLTLRDRYLTSAELNSLALSPDGKRLYTVEGTPPNPTWLLAVDPDSGALFGEIGNVSQPLAVLRAGR